jgi:hypothetical protein
MKAMAVERHMRFKSVHEFLDALNGERKVIPLNKEKRRRWMRRLSGIVAACVVLSVMSVILYGAFNKKQAAEDLKEATITIWFSVTEDSSEEIAMICYNAKDTMSREEASYKAVLIPMQVLGIEEI